MLRKRLFIIAFVFLALGTAFYICSFIPATQSNVKVVQIGTQAGASIVKFTLPLNYNDVVTFQFNGSYSLLNPMILTIVNQTGSIEYKEQIVDFPINVHLFNSIGEYVATFDGLETTNSTVLTVTIKEAISQTVYPYFYLAFVSPVPVLAAYFVLARDEKTKQRLEPIKNRILLPVGILLIVIIITFGVGLSFPNYIRIQAAIDVLKALVEADGVMLGLSGVMFAQLFSSIMGFQNVMFERRLTREKHPDYEACRKEIGERKKALITTTVGTLGFFLASIIASLISLTTVESFDPIKDTYAPFGLIFLPIYCLVTAIILLVFALAGISIEPPVNQEKNPEANSSVEGFSRALNCSSHPKS